MTARQRACALLLALTALAASAGAEAPAIGDTAPAWAYDLPNDLMSPFCPGRSLADCPSPDAASLRMWILVQAAAGRTRADVEEQLYARYGEVIRSAPKAEGFGTAAYLIPIAVFAGGGALVAWFLRRATRRAAAHPSPAAAPLDPEVERRLDEALSR
ncbi:MAG TPA: cytochrome c-type biogenesis protein CcmH [Myxococcota bacterium]|nr:cytochrome c-type biogenesis protein CcmH [Myxococcota bacterium]